jgi:hypothetical protein
MERDEIAEQLGSVVAQLDAIRLSIMADEPRRRTYLQAVKAQHDAENLLSQVRVEKSYFRFAAE